jgi:hypothetical protein
MAVSSVNGFEIPYELFKYKDFEKNTILSLLNRGLWFPKPEQLNDPFDAQLKINNIDVSIDDFKESFVYFQKWYLKENGKEISLKNFDLFFENGKPSKFMKEEVSSLIQHWNEHSANMGVLSLSEDPKNTSMWSHYSDEHRGICIGYDPKLICPNLSNKLQDSLKKVSYKKECEIIRNAYLLYAKLGMGSERGAYSELFKDMLSTKSNDWSYEKEWRFLVPDQGGKLVNLEIDAITSITFGLRTSEHTKLSVSHILRYHDKKVQFYQITRCDKNVGLERISMDKGSDYFIKSYEY